MESPTMRIQDVVNYVGLCRASIYNRVKDGTFPKPRKLGPRINAWTRKEVEDWVNQKMETA